jgi:hypothetical protein
LSECSETNRRSSIAVVEDVRLLDNVEPSVDQSPANYGRQSSQPGDVVSAVEDQVTTEPLVEETAARQTGFEDGGGETSALPQIQVGSEDSAADYDDYSHHENNATTACRLPKDSSLEDVAFGLINSTVSLARGAYRTAKDVFHTLQANNAYVPKESEWTPTESTWTPRQSSYVPPNDDVPNRPTGSPMETLIEMGFGNRELNRQLLSRFSNDLDQVVHELVQSSDASWHVTRH